MSVDRTLNNASIGEISYNDSHIAVDQSFEKLKKHHHMQKVPTVSVPA